MFNWEITQSVGSAMGPERSIRLLVRSIAMLALCFGCAWSAYADAPPRVNLLSASLVSSSDAATYYGSSTTHTNGYAAWSQSPPEITALAQSLGAARLASGQITADRYAQNVFDYIRNNIAVEFRYGLGKGARGALIDQSGTPFDQAELMVKLLSQAGVGASYQIGTVSLSAQQFGQWTGLVRDLQASTSPVNPYSAFQTFNVDAKAACQFLADGGIPASVQGVSDCSSLSGNLPLSGASIAMNHIWVAVGGKLYDPSFKYMVLRSLPNLVSLMGCSGGGSTSCGDQVEAAATSGATPGTFAGAPTISVFFGAGFSTATTLAANLQHAIENTNGAMSVDDLVGAPTIYATTQVSGGTLPYSTSVLTTWSDIPDQYRTKLTIHMRLMNGQSDIPLSVDLFADEIAGRKITVGGASPTIPNFRGLYTPLQFFMDGVALSCPTCTPGSDGPVESFTLSVDHPYAANGGQYADEQIVTSIVEPHYWQFYDTYQSFSPDPLNPEHWDAGSPPYTIIHGFGDSFASVQSHISDLQNINSLWTSLGCRPSTSSAAGAADCRDGNQPVIAESILQYRSLLQRLSSGITNTRQTQHHSLGVVYQSRTSGKNFISIQSAASLTSETSDPAMRTRAFEIGALTLSVAERGAASPTIGGVDVLGALTYYLPDTPSPIINVTPDKMAAVLAALPAPTTWGSYFIQERLAFEQRRRANLQAAADAGYSVLMRGTGETQPTTVLYKPGSVAYTLWETVKGGAGFNDPVNLIMNGAQASDAGALRKKAVSIASSDGQLTLQAPPDIVVGSGEFPMSLPFVRTYQGGASERFENDVLQRPYMDTGTYGPGSDIGRTTYNYSGPDQDAFGRLGGGWNHNYNVSALLSGDPARAFGSENATEASSAVAAIVILNDLFANDDLQHRVTATQIGSWLGNASVNNMVLVKKGGPAESFVMLPDGTFRNPQNPSARVSGTLQSPKGSFDAPQTLTYTGSQGDQINFSLSVVSCVRRSNPDWYTAGGYLYSHDCLGAGTLYGTSFKADSWTFPNGGRLDFEYIHGNVNSLSNSSADGPAGWENGYTYVLSRVTNNLGHSLTFTTNFSGGIVGYTRITDVKDETGRTVHFDATCGTNQYLLCDALTVTGPTGRVTRYEYTADQTNPDPSVLMRSNYRLRRWYTPGNSANPYQTLAYDDMFRVKSVTDILSHTTNYLPGGLFGSDLWKPGATVDPLGNVTHSYFDEHNSLTVSIAANGVTTTNTYDALNRLVLTVFPEGNSKALTYDIRGNVLTTVLNAKPGSNLSAITASTTYMEGASVLSCSNQLTCNKPTYETNGRGFNTYYGWKTNTGLLASVLSGMNADGSCPFGSVCPRVDVDYDSQGGVFMPTTVVKTVDATRSLTTTYSYKSDNHYVLDTAMVDSTGLKLTTKFTFDGIGNLTQVDGPRTDVTDVTNFAWDSDRRLTMKIDPATNDNGTAHPSIAAKYTYDADSQLIQVDKGTATAPDESHFTSSLTTKLTFDPAGNKIQETTPTSVMQYSYDADDRVLCTAVRMNPAVFGTVPASSVITTLPTSSANGSTLPDACTLGSTAANGDQDRITLNVYDAVGQLRQTVRGYGTAVQHVYETIKYSLNGRQIALGDADEVSTIGVANADALNANAVTQHQTNYVYDGFDRLIQTIYADGSGDQIAQYDNDNNPLTRITRDGRTISYTYDSLDRIATKAVPAVANVSAANTVNWSYDLVNKATAIWDSLGNKLTSCYDLAGRQMSATSSTSGASFTCGNTPVDTATTRTVGYQVDEAGNRTQIVWPDGSYAVTYSYDAANRMTTAVDNGGVALATFDYDQQGRPAWRQYPAGAANDKISYSWTPESDLLTLSHELSGTAYDVSYRYVRDDGTTPGYNPAHQNTNIQFDNSAYKYLQSAGGTTNYAPNGLNQYSSVGGQGYGYDLNGNLTSDGNFTFGYDPENRLMTAAKTGSAVVYAYDPLGRRTTKTVTGGSFAGTTYFLTSGDDEIAEYDGSGNLLRRYVPGPGVDQPIAMVTAAGVKTFFHQDKTGSVIAMSDASGNLVEGPYTYDPFGNCLTGGVACSGGVPYKYTGRRYDPETGLYYYRARYYSAVIGRFLQTDPIGYKDDVDWYAYVGNDPTDKTDPTGMIAGVDDAAEAALVVGGAVTVAAACQYSGACPETAKYIWHQIDKITNHNEQAPGSRPGKPFTPKGKEQVKDDNKAAHGGQQTCENCGEPTVPAQQGQAGVTPPGNETHVDHIEPKSKGGSGTAENGQVLCRTCNLAKGDKPPQPQPKPPCPDGICRP